MIVGRGMGLVVCGQAVGEDFAVFGSGVGFKGDIAFYASMVDAWRAAQRRVVVARASITGLLLLVEILR